MRKCTKRAKNTSKWTSYLYIHTCKNTPWYWILKFRFKSFLNQQPHTHTHTTHTQQHTPLKCYRFSLYAVQGTIPDSAFDDIPDKNEVLIAALGVGITQVEQMVAFFGVVPGQNNPPLVPSGQPGESCTCMQSIISRNYSKVKIYTKLWHTR